MIKALIIGNVGNSPTPRYTPSGQMVTSVSVASNYRDETTWVRCSAFGKLAEVANEHLSKGKQVFVEGHMKTNTFERRDGSTGFSLECVVSDIQFLGQKQQASEPQGDFEDDTESPF